MKNLMLKLALPVLALSTSSHALAQDDSNISVSVSVDYVSEYVFRGVTLAGSAFQPGAEISVGNFTAGVWASVASGEESIVFADEIDFYAGYGFNLSEKISGNIGATLYHYPQSGGVLDIGANDASTLEIFGGLSFDTSMAPNITAYYDFTLQALTVIGGAEHSFPLGEKTRFDVGANTGLVTVDGPGDYQYGTLSGALSYGFDGSTSVYIGINGGLNSQNAFLDTNFDLANPASISAPSKSSVWFGVGISSGF